MIVRPSDLGRTSFLSRLGIEVYESGLDRTTTVKWRGKTWVIPTYHYGSMGALDFRDNGSLYVYGQSPTMDYPTWHLLEEKGQERRQAEDPDPLVSTGRRKRKLRHNR